MARMSSAAPTLHCSNSDNQPVSPGIVCDPESPSPGWSPPSVPSSNIGEPFCSSRWATRLQGSIQLRHGRRRHAIFPSTPGKLRRSTSADADIGLFVGDDWKLKPEPDAEHRRTLRRRRKTSATAATSRRASRSRGRPERSNQTAPTLDRHPRRLRNVYDRFSEQNVLIAQRYSGSESTRQYLFRQSGYIPQPISVGGRIGQLRFKPSTPSASDLAGAVSDSILHRHVERQLPAKTTLAVTLHQLARCA